MAGNSCAIAFLTSKGNCLSSTVRSIVPIFLSNSSTTTCLRYFNNTRKKIRFVLGAFAAAALLALHLASYDVELQLFGRRVLRDELVEYDFDVLFLSVGLKNQLVFIGVELREHFFLNET